MAKDFKKQASEARTLTPRFPVPQVDAEAVKPTPAVVVEPAEPTYAAVQVSEPLQGEPTIRTIVDTNEQPVNKGFSMYPSRHKQIVRDLVYIEDRKPWEIVEDALEEYVVKHYGKQYKRK